MACFSPVNGAYPHKDQIDRSCLVNGNNEANLLIERGTIVYVNQDGEFDVVEDSSTIKGQTLYFALQPYGDMQAAMAGFRGFTGGGKGVHTVNGIKAVVGATGDHTAAQHNGKPYGQPKITGLSFQEHGNYQTDMYDHDEASFQIGDPLKVENGIFVKADVEADAVAHVYAAPDDYYFNGATLQEGWSTGAWIKVLRVSL